MSDQTAAARRYAEAIFQLGDEGNSLAQWEDELHQLAPVARDPGVLAVLNDEKKPLAARSALLERALDGMSPLTRNFAKLLLTRGRFALLPEIVKVFQGMVDQRNGVVRALVTTAVPLSDEDQRSIGERLRALTGAREVRVESAVDPAIIGGLVARVGDRLIDGSTRSRLIQLRRRLANAPR